MKLGLFYIALIFSFTLSAQDFTGEIRNLNINYTHPSGTGSTDYLNIDQVLYDQKTNYEVELQAGSLFLTTPDNMIQIDNLPSAVTGVDNLTIRNMRMLSNSTQIRFGVDKLRGSDSKQKQDIDRMTLRCDKELAGSTFNETVLHSCLNIKGSLRVGKYRQNGKEQFSALKFDTKRSRMTFEIKISGLKAKGKGRTYYQNDMIRIKIDKAFVGPINVKRKLFDELKKMRSPTFRVKSPWIEVDV